MPDHWQEKSIGEVASIVSERVDPTSLEIGIYVGLEHLVSNARSLSEWGSTSDVSSSTTPFLPGDTLFGRLRPYLRKGVVAPVAGVCSPEILVLRGQEGIDPRFLGLLVLRDAVFEECNRLSAGSRMPRVSAKDLMKLSVLVPPLSEQRRIANLVGSIDSYIDSLQTQVEATRAACSALLAELLSNPRDNWKYARLGDVSTLQIGRTPPRSDAKYWSTDLERPFCTIADMNGRYCRPVREGVTELAEQEGKAKRISAGTLLMSFKLTIGRVAFADCDLFPNEAIVSILPDQRVISAEFLYYFLGSQDLTRESGLAVKGKTLNGASLRSIEVMLPSLKEQQEIVDLMDVVERQIETVDAQRDAALKLRAGVLPELLAGQRLLDASYDVAVSL